MKIVIDTDIPYIKGVFEPYFGKVIYKKGIEIVHNDIKDAVALIVRTRTICNEALLKGSGIRAIATATVGTDHIDIDYCNTQGIEVFSAPGSNAGGVLQWMIAVLFELSQGTGLQGKVLGVIGVGRIGGLLVKAAEALGLTVLQCDPPRARIEGDKHFFPLKVLLKECDLFSFHVPLSFKGVDATYQMAGNDFLK
ncbi:MAG: erythronate-4-phosphate dehydrogenase, partial [Rikenellaceae bacterium]|nr:erythronate-4-phosphate dehydrogenase [Rikenellaceae bacterium]